MINFFYYILSLSKFKHLISKGDILVAINDNNVIDESYEGIVMLLDMLMYELYYGYSIIICIIYIHICLLYINNII